MLRKEVYLAHGWGGQNLVIGISSDLVMAWGFTTVWHWHHGAYTRGGRTTLRLEAHGLEVTISIMIRAHRKGIRVFKNYTNLLWGCCSQRPHYLSLFCDLWPFSIEGQCPQEEEGVTASNHGTVFMLDSFCYYRKTIRHLELCISLKTSFFYPVSLHMRRQTHFSGSLNKLFSWSKTSALF